MCCQQVLRATRQLQCQGFSAAALAEENRGNLSGRAIPTNAHCYVHPAVCAIPSHRHGFSLDSHLGVQTAQLSASNRESKTQKVKERGSYAHHRFHYGSGKRCCKNPNSKAKLVDRTCVSKQGVCISKHSFPWATGHSFQAMPTTQVLTLFEWQIHPPDTQDQATMSKSIDQREINFQYVSSVFKCQIYGNLYRELVSNANPKIT